MAILPGLLQIASLALTANAALDRGFGGYGDAFLERVGPYDANSTEFLRAVEQSNATGVFRIPGYDVSKPFPGAPMDGWTLSITALDFSDPDGRGRRMDPDYESMMGYSMKIQAPDSLLTSGPAGDKAVNAHDSWGMCLYNWGHPFNKTLWNNPSNKPLNPDGSCKGFVSDACIAAIEKKALGYSSVATSRNESRNPFGSMVRCSGFPMPDDVCGEYGPGNAGGPVPSHGGVPVPYLNGSVTNEDGWLFEMDKGEYYNSTEDLRQYWDSMVLNYWPVLVVWVNATIDAEAYDFERTKFARMSCVAPNGAGTGKAAFTFSGTAPGTVPGGVVGGGGGGGDGGGDDKKNAAGRGLALGVDGFNWVGLFWLWLWLWLWLW